MYKVLLRTVFAVLVLTGIYFIYANKYLAPYYIQKPDATSYPVPKEKVYLFPGLSGPQKKTQMPEEKSTGYQQFNQGGLSRLAILLTDENSYWLDLAHALKAAGIPFTITKDYRQALKHQVVMVYPGTVGLPEPMIKALARFPEQGKTLLTQGLIAPELNETFGISQSAPLAEEKLSSIHFKKESPLSQNFQYPEQRTIRIGDGQDRTFAVAAYNTAKKNTLAVYENHRPAIIKKDYAQGHAYALGLDLGRFAAIGYSNRQWGNQTISREYVNAYEPHIDTLMQLIQTIYKQNQEHAVTLSPVPEGKKLAVIFSFDNDSAAAVASMGIYKDILQEKGLKGTFFILTKYISDGDDFAFFTEKNLPLIQALVDAGMDVNSEGVSHSFDFDKFPLGTGTEQYPDYQPYVMHTRDIDTHTILGEIAETITYNGSILGELRVSRFLLHHFFSGLALQSFRPGFLKNPMQLPQALAATGYSYNSATTAGDALTHLPFQLSYNRGVNSMVQAQLPLYEFPITLEDQKGLAIDERLPQALELAKKISSFGGLYLVLIHPDAERAKPSFLRQFIKKVPEVTTVFFTTISDYGNWWAARDNIAVDTEASQGRMSIHLKVPEAMSGLTLNVPKGFVYEKSEPKMNRVRQDSDALILSDTISGDVVLYLTKHSARSA